MYRFRKVVERPDWPIPLAITLEITYEASPVHLTEDDESTGGVSDVRWFVARLQTPAGRCENPDLFVDTRRALCRESGFHDALDAFCEEDYAHRDQ